MEARGAILLFTDDDCVPMPDWLDAMLAPFNDPEVIGVKGVYRTHQQAIAARFVQVEYEDKYRLMSALPSIDFIDTYSAGFIRARFLEMGGYDTSFPVACAEDVELSYRMSARGWQMRFVPQAIVYHTHPDTLSKYLRKKYKFAFWRVLAVSKNTSKGVKDSHTPQVAIIAGARAGCRRAGRRCGAAKDSGNGHRRGAVCGEHSPLLTARHPKRPVGGDYLPCTACAACLRTVPRSRCGDDLCTRTGAARERNEQTTSLRRPAQQAPSRRNTDLGVRSRIEISRSSDQLRT
jgi:hypothetical protein